ncbi:tetratricopeptide repeat-containing sensor histidine kinase [Emticicia sp. SJ17W-69]|uniref:tetratricopeptide repeat-containing sensor histidine kinase n=1 Tax=Emticicia sp. SJ17W-69 TaxID=3421657 RepID=UPI003EBC53A7
MTFTLLLALTYGVGFAQNKQDVRLTLKQQLVTAQADTTKFRLLGELVDSYLYNNVDTGLVYAKQKLELSKKLNDKKGEVISLAEISTALTISGNFTSALYYGFENIAVSEKLQDSLSICIAYMMLGVCYREQEDYKEALKFAYKGLNYSKNLRLEPNALGLVSSIYERSNQLDSALYYGLKANKLTKIWSGLYLILGNIYLKLKQRDLAFDYYRKGIPVAIKYFVYIDLVDIYNKMSIEYELAGKRDSSIYYARKSIDVEGVNSYAEGKLRASTQLAKLYEKKGIKDSTIKYLKISETLRNNLFNRQKIREAQAFAFNEKLHQQKLSTQIQENQNKIKLYVLLVIIIASLGVVFLLWRNNQHKQKANNLLSRQKEEINLQREKAEKALIQLKATEAQLIQSEKLASLGELTAGIAHEIQNPLNFVNNFSELSVDLAKELKEEIKKPEKDWELIDDLANDLSQNQEKINYHGKRASNIVKGMLEHARTSSGVKELTDMNALADEYLRLAYHGLRAKDKDFNATLETHFDENLPKIEVVTQDIGRVLLNLINNAFYAVSQRKNLQGLQDLTGLDIYEPKVIISTENIDNQLTIKVKDNGIGMSEATKAKIFQPFFTTKPTGQGTGLGLSLAYDIITKGHAGTIEVNSFEGEGSTFIIKLPITFSK